MNLDLLKQAAEVAGAIVDEKWHKPLEPTLVHFPGGPTLPVMHKTLPVYVASLLVEKAQLEHEVGRDHPDYDRWEVLWWEKHDTGDEPIALFGKNLSVLLIAAAMVALDEWDIPTAKEFIASCD